MKRSIIALTGLLLAGSTAWGSGMFGPFTVDNRLRVEWDDNIYQTETNQQDSVKFIEQVQVMADFRSDTTFFSIRYQPSFLYWESRDDDDDDLHHEADVLLNHKFSPRFSIGLNDTLRRAERPELIDDEDGFTIRPDQSFLYNALKGSASLSASAQTRLSASAGYTFLAHDDEDFAKREDYEIINAGLSLSQQIDKMTVVGVNARFEDLEYTKNPDPVDVDGDGIFEDRGRGQRGADTYQFGLSVQHTISKNMLANVGGGYELREFDQANTDNASSPYGSVSLTYLPSPRTRVSGGGSYSLYEADVYPYTSQQRTSFFASLGHDLTKKVTWFISGTYLHGDYDAEQTLETVDVQDFEDGEDDAYQVSTRIDYRVSRDHSLELHWQFTDLTSDLREDYERNRISVGWRARL
jgi:hypothetical protein